MKLKHLFPGEWVTEDAHGNFCVMGRETAIHTNGFCSNKRSQRLLQAASILFDLGVDNAHMAR